VSPSLLLTDDSPARRCIPVAMNSEKDVDPDLPDPEAVESDTEALERSQDAIDEGRDAAQEALKDNPPDPDQTEQPESEA
jgi:ABC-type nitrate/sulfonate/bicarbonate transport system substrate-binding protein